MLLPLSHNTTISPHYRLNDFVDFILCRSETESSEGIVFQDSSSTATTTQPSSNQPHAIPEVSYYLLYNKLSWLSFLLCN